MKGSGVLQMASRGTLREYEDRLISCSIFLSVVIGVTHLYAETTFIIAGWVRGARVRHLPLFHW